jgi:integrase
MSKRKPNLRSSIYGGADGRWHGWVTMGVKDDGSPDRRHRTGKTEAEVTEKVRKLEQSRDAGKVDKPGRTPTVAEWMTTYLDTIAILTLAPRSYDDYWSKTRVWIIPCLGQHRLDRLMPEHIDKMHAKMAAAGRSSSHALKVYRVLSRALEVAVRRGKAGRNACKLVDPPSLTETEIVPLTQDEARRVLAAAASRRNGARWSVGLALGLREGEALGLRWSYLDLDAGIARIWWQVSRANWRHGCDDPHACGERFHRVACSRGCDQHKHSKRCPADCKKLTHACPKPCPRDCRRHAANCPKRHGGGIVFREPKGKSKRIIPLPVELVPVLRGHRTEQLKERLAAGTAWYDHDLVFCRHDGRPISRSDDWCDWKQLLQAAGIRDVRVHDGRHTAGTLLIEQGVHVRTVQEILGHSRVTVTERYTHVASPMAEEAAQRMNRALWGPR